MVGGTCFLSAPTSLLRRAQTQRYPPPHSSRDRPVSPRAQPYQGGEASDGRRIYVGNINYDFREEELRNRFEEVRAILERIARTSATDRPCLRVPRRRCAARNLRTDRTPLTAPSPSPAAQFGTITAMSYKQGFAFVDYADMRDAEDAIASMNGKQLGGRSITVELSGRPPRGEKPDRTGEGGNRPPPRYNEGGDYRADARGSFGGAGGGHSRSQGSSDTATKNLFVANIPETLNEEDIRNHFSR